MTLHDAAHDARVDYIEMAATDVAAISLRRSERQRARVWSDR